MKITNNMALATLFCFFLWSCHSSKVISTEIEGFVSNQDKQDSLYEFTDIERKTVITQYKLKKDTAVFTRYIPKKRTIFKRGKIYCYDVAYIDKTGDTLSFKQIQMIPLGRRDPMALNQDDIVFYNTYNKEDSLKFKTCPLNFSYPIHWRKDAMEGVIENSEQVWIHPLRCNYFFFTEVAPFPMVYRPIYKGQTWQDSLKVLIGGDWSNKTIQHQYRVIQQVNRRYGEHNLACWQIKAKGRFDLGVSYLEYFFNEENGFVEMNYVNFGGQKLNIVLRKIEYKKDLTHIFWENRKNFWLHNKLTD
jgi:hypothetical protein